MPDGSGVFGYTPPVNTSLSSFIAPPEVSSNALRTFGVGENTGARSGNHVSVADKAIADAQAAGAGADHVKSALAGKLENFGSGVSILGDLANIYFGFQQQKQARRSFQGQMGFANANLENTVKSYNTRLSDIFRARGFTQGDSQEATNQAISANSLNFQRIKA